MADLSAQSAQYAQILQGLQPGSMMYNIVQNAMNNPDQVNPLAIQQDLAPSAPPTSYAPSVSAGNIPFVGGSGMPDPSMMNPIIQARTPQTSLSGSGAQSSAPQGSQTNLSMTGAGSPTPPPGATPGSDAYNIWLATQGLANAQNGATTQTGGAPPAQGGTTLSGSGINQPSYSQPYNPYGNSTQAQFPQPRSPIGQPYNIPSSPVGPGANSAFPNWTNTPGGNGQGYTQGDPGYMASAEANRAIDYGNQFENQYDTEYQQALGQQNAYQGQADQSYSDLAAVPGYTSAEAGAIQADPYGVMNTVNNTQQRMDAAIDPSKLGVSDQYVGQLKDQAGRQIGLQYGAAQDQLQRQAEASGNVNPLALSAARDRLLRSSAIDQADAVTGADLAATGQQRQANTNIANMQLGAATTLGGMGLNAGQYADTAASNRAANVAQQRIQGQQAARNYWQSQGQFQGGQANQATQARLAGAQTSLSGMGQGGQLAATTEIGRKSTRPQIGFNVGPGGTTIGGSIGI
jgi:hypothetical protein